MEKLTAEQIHAILKSKIKDVEDVENNYNGTYFEDVNRVKIDELGKVITIDEYGGEGQGDTWYKVYFFKDHNVYLKLDGFYNSYEGVMFDGWSSLFEVAPVERTITVYQ
jgi:hypothetical protein